MRRRALLALATMAVGIVVLQAAAGAAEFPLRQGDLVVMVGDSITAQHLHSNYIESYCLARFPSWNLRFRNSGVGGDTIPSVLGRFDVDVANWKPTVVTVELGMNDSGGGAPAVDPYMRNYAALVGRITQIGARPVILTASPVNDGTRADKLQGRNTTLDAMATRVVQWTGQNALPCADQFHALLDLWGKNLAEGQPVPLKGDGVHPGAPGQLTMAWACLVGLGAPSEVSSATIDAAAPQVTKQSNCAITDLKLADGRLSFSRLDTCLPWPIPQDARPGLQLVPARDQLDRYLLQVTGLPPGRYNLALDGLQVAEVGADELAAGYNLAGLETGPIADQLGQIIDLINRKAGVVGTRRNIAKFQPPDWLEDLAAAVAKRRDEKVVAVEGQIAALDDQIHAACQPRAHRFELTPK